MRLNILKNIPKGHHRRFYTKREKVSGCTFKDDPYMVLRGKRSDREAAQRGTRRLGRTVHRTGRRRTLGTLSDWIEDRGLD